MKNQGISLISLIITIIVIIILAAIVIFTGLGTPDSANFAHFCQDVDNVQSAVLNSFADLKVEYATANQTRTDEQIYMAIALGDKTNVSQYNTMKTDTVPTSADTSLATRDATAMNKACQNIVVDDNGKATILNMTLPKVRESVKGWYITKDGRVFNATGYVYNNETYYTSNVKDAAKLKVTTSSTYGTRAEKIATALATNSTTPGLTAND